MLFRWYSISIYTCYEIYLIKNADYNLTESITVIDLEFPTIMQPFQTYINQCKEASENSGSNVSHFYKFEKTQCVCVFCGKTVHSNTFNTIGDASFNFSQISVIGQRS